MTSPDRYGAGGRRGVQAVEHLQLRRTAGLRVGPRGGRVLCAGAQLSEQLLPLPAPARDLRLLVVLLLHLQIQQSVTAGGAVRSEIRPSSGDNNALIDTGQSDRGKYKNTYPQGSRRLQYQQEAMLTPSSSRSLTGNRSEFPIP